MTTEKTWQEQLDQAGAACDVDVETFVRAAWSAYLKARPGLKEYLEDLQLRAQLEELRRNGHIGQA
ncbi:MAG TPA: hypothetical protein VLX92_10410 [Kofleriaceae bacterium]|nr:hypothetical protein [Kofleriaceae bacterium]